MEQNIVKYMVIEGEDTDIRVADGGVAYIYHNQEHLVTNYFHDRTTDEVIDWDKLTEGKISLKDWEEQHEVTNEMIEDALAWLVCSSNATFVKVDSFKELMN